MIDIIYGDFTEQNHVYLDTDDVILVCSSDYLNFAEEIYTKHNIIKTEVSYVETLRKCFYKSGYVILSDYIIKISEVSCLFCDYELGFYVKNIKNKFLLGNERDYKKLSECLIIFNKLNSF